MSADRSVVLMPRVNANDDSGVLTAWLRTPGDAVRRGDIIAQIETTKAAVDIESDADGFIHPIASAGATVAVGEPIAWILSVYDPATLPAPSNGATAPAPGGERLVSRKARDRMAASGLQIQDIPGHGPIGEQDVEAVVRAGRATRRGAAPEQLKRLAVQENSLVVFGAASQGDVVLDALKGRPSHAPLCFIDERPKEDTYAGLPVFGPDTLAELHRAGVRFAHICVGDSKAKLRIAAMLETAGFKLASVVHPRAVVSDTARLGKGVFVGPGVIIGPQAEIGDLCQINNNATVPHHVRLGTAVRIADGAHLGGGITVGDCSYIGLGVTINTDCNIGAEVTIVSGVSVFDSVPNRATVRPPKTRL